MDQTEKWMKRIMESLNKLDEFGSLGGEIGHTKDLWKFTAPQKAVKEAWEKSEKVLDEKAPPGFPKKIYNKVKKEYPGEPEKAYATMWKIHNQIKETFSTSGENKSKLISMFGEMESAVKRTGNSEAMRQWNELKSKTIGREEYPGDLEYDELEHALHLGHELMDKFNIKYISDKEYQDNFGDVEPEDDYFLKDSAKKLKETSGTGAAPGYLTPNAFTGGNPKGEKKRKQSATTGTGYKIVGDK